MSDKRKIQAGTYEPLSLTDEESPTQIQALEEYIKLLEEQITEYEAEGLRRYEGEIKERDQAFKHQLDCAVARTTEHWSENNEKLAVFICDMSDAIFAERKKREAGE